MTFPLLPTRAGGGRDIRPTFYLQKGVDMTKKKRTPSQTMLEVMRMGRLARLHAAQARRALAAVEVVSEVAFPSVRPASFKDKRDSTPPSE